MVGPRSVRVALSFHPEAVREARSVLRDAAAGLAADVVDDAELLASELVTNALRHGSPAVELAVAVDATWLTVRVTDGSARRPALRRHSRQDDPCGRGLQMVEQMTAGWGVEPVPGGVGKTVWFRMGRSPVGGLA